MGQGGAQRFRWSKLIGTEKTKNQAVKLQRTRKRRYEAELRVWRCLGNELEAAANKPRVVLNDNGEWEGWMDEDPLFEAAVKEVFLDVADWFKRGKRLPEK